MSEYTPFNIDVLFELRFFSNLDYYFARSMARAFHETDPIVLGSCALVSKVLSEGHICLDIAAMSKSIKPVSKTGKEQVRFPDSDTWMHALNASSIVSNTTQTPLVLELNRRLYLSKYYDFQNRLIKNMVQRFFLEPLNINNLILDDMLASFLDRTNPHTLYQEKAVKRAVLNYFTIISGGPGTGKTFITTLIKKMVVTLAKENKAPEPRIICVAPTGKAASKMEQGGTIHSVLKPLKNSPGFFYNKKNQLQADVVIVDEASMIDISLLTRLLEAIPLSAKVIILGDQHQLSSIQAGSVFSDICRVNGLTPCTFALEYNFRSKGKTGIEKLSTAINANDAHSMENILTQGRYSDVIFENIENKDSIESRIGKYILKGYAPFINAGTKETALKEIDRFKILCAHNSGEYGTLQINHVCEKILRSENNFGIHDKHFKRMIMVTANDYKKDIFNGDTGIAFENKKENNAFFRTLNNKIKQYRYTDLPGSVTAFAITIHKSQGSEFNTVLIVVPDKLSPVITRQLLYTGVTRAKEKVTIIGNMDIIKQAISLSINRSSGLSECMEKELCRYEQKK